MTWVKICGITNLEDARIAVDAGADALGFVFYEKSPRCIDVETVKTITAEVPPGVETVGVFVDQTPDQVRELVQHTSLTAAQVYREDYALALATGRGSMAPPKIIFVVPRDVFGYPGGIARPDSLAWDMSGKLRDVLFALLLDSHTDSQPGGTGQRFDWIAARTVAPAFNAICRTVVAGGLEASNVDVAMTLLHPWGVDVSSGVEARPGKKDPDKVRAFIDAVHRADRKTD